MRTNRRREGTLCSRRGFSPLLIITFNSANFSLRTSCEDLPDLVGGLFVMVLSVLQLPAQEPSKHQEDEDEEKRPHSFATNHCSSVWSCKPSMKNTIFHSDKESLRLCFYCGFVADYCQFNCEINC
ncbi:hypothetical protein CHARACLAT_031318 [Characodon lateralis]|uniref:Uncharacterized protein n=1 Tax=Characodon lateralis TaxID=208331 RepID=A0ABU7EFT3_9TELE|nr:hypothetical protein [Characodon lateralis]